MRTSRVPRATIKPSERVVSFPDSSIRVRYTNAKSRVRGGTSHSLFDIIQNKIHQLIITLENTADCFVCQSHAHERKEKERKSYPLSPR